MPGSLLAHSAGGQKPAGYLPAPLLARAGSFSLGARRSWGREARVSLSAICSPTPHLMLVTDPLLIAWLWAAFTSLAFDSLLFLWKPQS